MFRRIFSLVLVMFLFTFSTISHTEESLFIPKDMDASIYNGKDLKFINHYEFSIKVEVYLTDSQCLVLIRRA